MRPLVSVNPHDIDYHSGSIGLPVPSTEAKLVDDDDNEVAPGEPGELCVKGPQVMLGYWQRPDATDEIIKDGWLHTGDIAVMDEEGFLRIVDRKKDMILVSGFNVYPNEIEDVVMQHSGVLEVAAVGVPSGSSGEAVKIFVVKKNASLTEEGSSRSAAVSSPAIKCRSWWSSAMSCRNRTSGRYYDENYVTKPVPKWTIRPELHANRPDAGLAGVFMGANKRETVLNYQMITTNDELASLCEVTRDFPAIATDTEFVRTRTYYPQLGLIQMYDGKHVSLIDPLGITDWTPMRDLLLDTAVTKYLHAGSEDLEVFLNTFGIMPQPLIDTQILAAFSNRPLSWGFAAMVEATGLTTDKSESRTDWLARLLTERQLDYAAADVFYLLPIAGQLMKEAEASGWLPAALDECRMTQQRRRNTDPKEAGAISAMRGSCVRASVGLSAIISRLAPA